MSHNESVSAVMCLTRHIFTSLISIRVHCHWKCEAELRTMSERGTLLTMGAVLSFSSIRGRGYSRLPEKQDSQTSSWSSSASPMCTKKEESCSCDSKLQLSTYAEGEPISVIRTPPQDRILAELEAHRTWSNGS